MFRLDDRIRILLTSNEDSVNEAPMSAVTLVKFPKNEFFAVMAISKGRIF